MSSKMNPGRGKQKGKAIEARKMLQYRNREIVARASILGAILKTFNLEERLDLILDSIVNFLKVEFAMIHLIQNDKMILKSWKGISDSLRSQILFFQTDKLPEWMKEKQIVHERLSERKITPEFMKSEGIQSWVCIPLILPEQKGIRKEKLLGIITVATRNYKAIDKNDVKALESIAEYLALAIDHAYTYRQSIERLARLQTLREIDKAIIQRLDLKEILFIVLDKIPKELGADAVAISLLDEYQMETKIFVMRLPNKTVIEAKAFTLAENLFHWFIERKEPVIIYDLEKDPRVQMYREYKKWKPGIIFRSSTCSPG
jgi:GAF domain-containing protein